MGDVLGLGLESSCDETAAAVVLNGGKILSNEVFSQIDLHREYYGVVPEIASRAHLEVINALIDKSLKKAGTNFKEISYVAVTNRPGLVGSLLIGLQSAKALSYVLNIPLIAVNHLEAHLYAPFLEGREYVFPFMGLLVSGGNTALSLVHGVGDMEQIGRTVDDAAGEAFDKISKYLDLGYPGGPAIEKLAKKAVRKNISFPRILTEPGDMRFSYSGLKTAVISYTMRFPEAAKEEIAYGFQECALELLARRLFAASRERNIKKMVVAGGVACNGRLRELLENMSNSDENIIIPSPVLCTDNAAMVAGIGYHYYARRMLNDLTTDVFARV